MTKASILSVLLVLTPFCSFGQTAHQCDSIKIYNEEFDMLFQRAFNAVQADTVLAIRHCGSTYGCSDTFGLLCWKKNGQFYFQQIQRKKGKTTLTAKLEKDLKEHLMLFYTNRIFDNILEIEEKNNLWIDDGPTTLLLFKTPDTCWRFGYGISMSEDIKVVWTNALLTHMRH